MVREDPYDAEPPFAYECVVCQERVRADRQPLECPGCGGRMRDLSVPRQQ